MINLNFNPKTGKPTFDGLTLEIDAEEGFCNSKLYHKLNTFNAVKKYMPYHYLIDSVFFAIKSLKLTYGQYVLVFLLWFILSIRIVNIINP